MKFTVDFNPPFEANVQDIEPYYVSTRDKENVLLFKEILDHVGEGVQVYFRPGQLSTGRW
ncbi:MAG: hypothetical protein WDO15_18250 [Bacteroidota bacterium]